MLFRSSVGETMAIGRTFKESFQKALRGLEVGAFGFGADSKDLWYTDRRPLEEDIRNKLARPNPDRVWYLRYAFLQGLSIDEIYSITGIDPWFLDQLQQIVEMENRLRELGALDQASEEIVRQAKQMGFSDRQLSNLLSSDDGEIRDWRKKRGITATFKSVDTCAAEFEAYTPYYYSTYESEDETPPKAPGKQIGRAHV